MTNYRECSLINCSNKHEAKGYCRKHYLKWRSTGDPLATTDKLTPEERFWAKVDKSTSELGCWLWTAASDGKGYGKYFPEGRSIRAHRYSYELVHGTIPAGLLIDHRYAHLGCTRNCVNPEHLRPVTNKQNQENLSSLSDNNSSGYRGVWWNSYKSCWVARVRHLGSEYSKAGFCSAEDANEWAIAKRNELFTHNDADRR